MDLSGFDRPIFATKGVSLPGVESGFRSIHLDWPDFQSPAVGRRFWEVLVRDLQTLAKREKGLHLVVFCSQGHGRTGTALSILGKLLGCIPKDVDPIQHVRSVYCHEAVESNAQISYIESILDYRSSCSPSSRPIGVVEYGYGSYVSETYKVPAAQPPLTPKPTTYEPYKSTVLSQRWVSTEGKLCEVKRSLTKEEFDSDEWKWDPMARDYYRIPKSVVVTATEASLATGYL